MVIVQSLASWFASKVCSRSPLALGTHVGKSPGRMNVAVSESRDTLLRFRV